MKCKNPDCDEEVVQTGNGRPKVFHDRACRKDFWDKATAEEKLSGTRSDDHKMTDVDPITRLGICSKCGPQTLAYKGGGKSRPGRWRCSNRVNLQQSRLEPKPHSDPIQYAVVRLRNRGIRLTRDQYIALCARAGGRCENCGRTPARLYFDHCHPTRKARGHLCNSCNTGLGKLGDRAGLLRALEYLDMAEDWLKDWEVSSDYSRSGILDPA